MDDIFAIIFILAGIFGLIFAFFEIITGLWFARRLIYLNKVNSGKSRSFQKIIFWENCLLYKMLVAMHTQIYFEILTKKFDRLRKKKKFKQADIEKFLQMRPEFSSTYIDYNASTYIMSTYYLNFININPVEYPINEKVIQYIKKLYPNCELLKSDIFDNTKFLFTKEEIEQMFKIRIGFDEENKPRTEHEKNSVTRRYEDKYRSLLFHLETDIKNNKGDK